MTTIRFRRGERLNLPASAPSGMPLWCEDTKELYMGTDDGVAPIIANNSDETIQGYVPYSVNSGNQDANGYADLIQKVSDTEVSFKVGGIYPNLGITFPNGRHYEISSIDNLTGFAQDSIYTFVIFEENLTDNGDGTYSAIVAPVQIGYSTANYDILTPAMQSDSQDGWVVSTENTYGSGVAYPIYDQNYSTGAYEKRNGMTVVQCPEQKTVWGYGVRSKSNVNGHNILTGWEMYGSNDGINWTLIQADSGNTNNTLLRFEFPTPQTWQYFGLKVKSGTFSEFNVVTLIELEYYEYFSFPGGAITEDIKFPEDYDASIVPAKTANSGTTDGTGWTSSAIASVGGMEAFHAFDGSFADNNRWYTGINNVGWLKIAKDSGTFDISRIAITAPEDSTYTSTPKDFTIRDEADNILATFTNQIYAPNETKYFDVVATGISAIKIDITSTNGGTGLAAKEVKLYTSVTSQAGDLAVLTNQIPLRSYLRKSSGWVEKQFLKIGQVQKLSGLLGTPVTYAFNGYYESNWFQVSAGNAYTVNHNLANQWFIPHYYTSTSADGGNGMYVNLAQIGPNGYYGYNNKYSADGKNKLKFVIASNGVLWDGNNYGTAYTKVIVKRSF